MLWHVDKDHPTTAAVLRALGEVKCKMCQAGVAVLLLFLLA